VLAPKDSLALLLAGSDYPAQPTSWSGAYHVLQRYGAYVALGRFSEVFDERGMLRMGGREGGDCGGTGRSG
jgi:hypothetical protein